MASYEVIKQDAAGRDVWSYQGDVVRRTAESVQLEAYFNRDDMVLSYTTLKRNDRFVETFYAQRWYNVFAVYDRDDGALKGWYCNVSRPAEIGETAVAYQDLALDVWVSAEGQPTILDEDEFEELDLTTRERDLGRGALRTILDLAAQDNLPR